MAGTLAFTVLTGPWTAGEHGTFVDDVEIGEADAELVRLASHAHAAGILDVTEGLDVSGVQSQEDGESAYAAAQESGTWQVGNVAQYELQTAQAAVDRARQALADAQEDDTVTDEHAQAVTDAEEHLAAVDTNVRARILGGQA